MISTSNGWRECSTKYTSEARQSRACGEERAEGEKRREEEEREGEEEGEEARRERSWWRSLGAREGIKNDASRRSFVSSTRWGRRWLDGLGEGEAVRGGDRRGNRNESNRIAQGGRDIKCK